MGRRNDVPLRREWRAEKAPWANSFVCDGEPGRRLGRALLPVRPAPEGLRERRGGRSRRAEDTTPAYRPRTGPGLLLPGRPWAAAARKRQADAMSL